MDLHTGVPLWVARDRPLRTYPRLTANADTDVAVVGAGVTGALAAYELTRAGLDVVVLDKDMVAGGSSAATSGLLLYDTDTDLHQLTRIVGERHALRAYRLGLEAIESIERVCQDVGGTCGFARRPSVYLASCDEDVAQLAAEYRARQQGGFDVEFLERAQLRERYSFSAPAAMRSSGNAQIDCYQFTHRVLAAAADAGARVYAHTPIVAIRPDGEAWLLDAANGVQVRASRVINATGYEASTHLRRKTANLASTWVVVSRPLDTLAGWSDRCLIWETARPYLYLRTTDDGRLLVGGEDEPGPCAHDDVGQTRRKAARLLARARSMFPDITIEPEYCWGGTFATTDDGLPFIGESPECDRMWFALGYGGNGITFGVIAARLLRDAFLGTENPDAEIFRFDRRSPAR